MGKVSLIKSKHEDATHVFITKRRRGNGLSLYKMSLSRGNVPKARK